MRRRRIGQPVSVEPEPKQAAPFVLIRPVHEIVARMQNPVIIEDERFAGLEREFHPQVGLVGEAVEQIKSLNRLARQGNPRDFGRALDKRPIVHAANSAGAVEQYREGFSDPATALYFLVGHEKRKPRLQNRQQFWIFVLDGISNGLGADQPICAASLGRP